MDLHARSQCRRCGHTRHAHVPYLRGEKCSACDCQRFVETRFSGVAWWLLWFVPWFVGAFVLMGVGLWLLFQLAYATGLMDH